MPKHLESESKATGIHCLNLDKWNDSWNDELERMWKEVVVVNFNLSPHHFLEGTEEN